MREANKGMSGRGKRAYLQGITSTCTHIWVRGQVRGHVSEDSEQFGGVM